MQGKERRFWGAEQLKTGIRLTRKRTGGGTGDHKYAGAIMKKRGILTLSEGSQQTRKASSLGKVRNQERRTWDRCNA